MSSDIEQRKRIYERVLSCVYHQTSPKQPPGTTVGQLITHLCDHADEDAEAVETAIRAAKQNGDLVRWRDARGRWRLTKADDEDALERARDRLVANIDEWTDQDRDQLGTINTALHNLND